MTSPVPRTGSGSDAAPGTSGIWTFVFIDMMVFGLLFLTFVSERIRLPEPFASAQRELNPTVGLIGTLLLIASSWAVAAAIHSIRRGATAHARAQLTAAILLGLGFAITD
jgi:nitric oxide reductase NorE protein